MKAKYGKLKTTNLQLPVQTRWSSMCACIDSLIKNKNALRTLAIDDENATDLGADNIKNILNAQFWIDLADLLRILQPIQKYISILEGDDINLFSETFEAFYNIALVFENMVDQSFFIRL